MNEYKRLYNMYVVKKNEKKSIIYKDVFPKKINIEYNKNIDDSKLKLLFKKLNKKLNYEMDSYYSFNSENDKIKDIFSNFSKKIKNLGFYKELNNDSIKYEYIRINNIVSYIYTLVYNYNVIKNNTIHSSLLKNFSEYPLFSSNLEMIISYTFDKEYSKNDEVITKYIDKKNKNKKNKNIDIWLRGTIIDINPKNKTFEILYENNSKQKNDINNWENVRVPGGYLNLMYFIKNNENKKLFNNDKLSNINDQIKDIVGNRDIDLVFIRKTLLNILIKICLQILNNANDKILFEYVFYSLHIFINKTKLYDYTKLESIKDIQKIDISKRIKEKIYMDLSEKDKIEMGIDVGTTVEEFQEQERKINDLYKQRQEEKELQEQKIRENMRNSSINSLMNEVDVEIPEWED
jgi:hypothetical protein